MPRDAETFKRCQLWDRPWPNRSSSPSIMASASLSFPFIFTRLIDVQINEIVSFCGPLWNLSSVCKWRRKISRTTSRRKPCPSGMMEPLKCSHFLNHTISCVVVPTQRLSLVFPHPSILISYFLISVFVGMHISASERIKIQQIGFKQTVGWGDCLLRSQTSWK